MDTLKKIARFRTAPMTKVPNSFSTTIFNRDRIQYESGAYAGTDFSDIFFFLSSTVDRVEDINLNAVNINISEFGENFDLSRLDFNSTEKENIRKSVINVLRKVADLISQNLKRNADGYLATVPHNNDSSLWPGGSAPKMIGLHCRIRSLLK